jgi:hypothetical protein
MMFNIQHCMRRKFLVYQSAMLLFMRQEIFLKLLKRLFSVGLPFDWKTINKAMARNATRWSLFHEWWMIHTRRGKTYLLKDFVGSFNKHVIIRETSLRVPISFIWNRITRYSRNRLASGHSASSHTNQVKYVIWMSISLQITRQLSSLGFHQEQCAPHKTWKFTVAVYHLERKGKAKENGISIETRF